MKTPTLYFQLLILTLLMVLFASCSTDEDNSLEEEAVFESVTLNLSGLGIQQVETSFQVEGYSFTSYRAESIEGFQGSFEGGQLDFGGLALWYPDAESNPSYIELNFDSAAGMSKITARVWNGGGTTSATLYNNEVILEDVRAPSGINDIVFNIEEETANRFRISSYEGAAISITLE